MELINGFIYKDKTLTKNNKEIKLTKMEISILEVLCTTDKVTFEVLENTVWKGKNFSRAAVRNKIMSIRRKTCDELIKNNHNICYMINKQEM